jgi:hypothetical protein
MLKVAVVVMGVLIVVGVMALVTILVQRVGGLVASPASVASLVDEPAGSHIAGASAAGDRVVLRLQGGGPDRVVVVDLRSGRVVGRVGLAR